ncbi:MAG: UDP-3-O-acyl-N-acetylglucosamine deacetylase [Proteobacteria bacterium]|nr:UDP-3-O-acyl-N-acetylglucosamine deacetylase [Pseudomonadota bacterium]
MQQHTIAEKVSCTGIGLHSGAPVELTLHPARADHGIVFVRRGGGASTEIPARPGAVHSTQHATTLGVNGRTIGTVEHLLAALYGLHIDNVRIEVNGPEVPVMDGSASPFVYLLRSAGLYPQRRRRALLRIRRPVEVRAGERRIRIEPAKQLEIDYGIDFAHPVIGRQRLRLRRIDPASFERELAPARTFGFLDEVSVLWRSGLARGGSLDNTVVLDERRVVNPAGLRSPDEFVRHKALDLLGDLALLGLPVQGRVVVERGGHAVHQRLIAALLARPDAWQIEGGEQRHDTEARVAAASALMG